MTLGSHISPVVLGSAFSARYGGESDGLIGVIAAGGAQQGYAGARGYSEDYEGEEDMAPSYRRRQTQSSGLLSLFQNQKRLGATLIALGLLFTTFGMMLFFEGNLLRLGNLFLLSGITLLLGPNKVRGFFMKAERMQATIITSLGVFLVFTGKPRLGIICEIFGLLNLFGNMMPMLLSIAKQIPILGDVIKSITGEDRRAAF